jgi:hypothetical protein
MELACRGNSEKRKMFSHNSEEANLVIDTRNNQRNAERQSRPRRLTIFGQPFFLAEDLGYRSWL